MASSVAKTDLKRDKIWLVVFILLFLLAFGAVFKPVRLLPKQSFWNAYYTYRFDEAIGPSERAKDQLRADLQKAITAADLAPDTAITYPSTTELKIRVPVRNVAEASEAGSKLNDIVKEEVGEEFGSYKPIPVDTSEAPPVPLSTIGPLGIYRPKLHLRLGLDLQGGVHLVLKARTQNVEFEYKLADTAEELQSLVDQPAAAPAAEEEAAPAETPAAETKEGEVPAETPAAETKEGEATPAETPAADTKEGEATPAEPETAQDGGEPVRMAQGDEATPAAAPADEGPAEVAEDPEEARLLADEQLRNRSEEKLFEVVARLKASYGERIGEVHAELVSSNIAVIRTQVDLSGADAQQKIGDHQQLLLHELKETFPNVTQLGEPEQLDIDTSTAMRDVTRIIGERIDRLGVAEANVREQGTDRVVVELPGIRDPDEAIDLLGTTARLEFRKVPETYDVQTELDARGRNEISFILKDSNTPVPDELVYYEAPEFKGDKNVIVGSELKPNSVQVTYDQNGQPAIALELNDEAARRFDDFASENLEKYLAIYLDRRAIDARVLKERHYGGSVLLTGGFGTVRDATNLKILLDAGALPVPVDVVEQRTVSATLGADSVRQSSRAALWGLILILITMIVLYKWPGFLADLALMGYCLLVLACLVMFDATLTLPGILGFVLSIGMAVDANVIIFERIKEELRENEQRPIAASIRNGYDRAFAAILDGNVTTLIIAVILFVMGTGPIRGFAVTLGIGIVCSMFTALLVTRTFQNLFAASKLGHSRRSYRS